MKKGHAYSNGIVSVTQSSSLDRIGSIVSIENMPEM
jgi:hypothetical protein